MGWNVISRLFLGVMLSTAVTGCTSFRPSESKLSEADYGTAISIHDAQQQAEHWLGSHLKDPDSARIEWGPFGQAWIFRGLVNGGFHYGYGLLANVNAKNSFGGYTGKQPFFFFYRDGQMQRWFKGWDDYNNMWGFRSEEN